MSKKPDNSQDISSQLSITTPDGATLSPAQIEFNKRLKALEKARAALEKNAHALTKIWSLAVKYSCPLVEAINQLEYDIILESLDYIPTIKFSKRRTYALYDLITYKAHSLLSDSVGLTPEQEANLLTTHTQLSEKLKQFGELHKQAQENDESRQDFATIAAMMEEAARKHGIDIDLSSIDINADPAEFERIMAERMAAVQDYIEKTGINPFEDAPTSTRKRKPTKAALEKERLRQVAEEAKNRDFKSLFKQLAKVLHPDLETNPQLKAHKESWMKRLTNAYDNGDLREMLAIEMEWLGEESENLAKATDDKLRIYAMVLKEQCDEIKERTNFLIELPEYSALRRFMSPFSTELDDFLVRLTLDRDLGNLKRMLQTLKARDTETRHMVNDWAETNAQSLR